MKKYIIGFITGILISGITVYASSLLSAREVRYKNSNVQDTIDGLYNAIIASDATDNEILLGKSALVGVQMVTGSMPNNGAWTSSSTDNQNVIIPAGYLNFFMNIEYFARYQ